MRMSIVSRPSGQRSEGATDAGGRFVFERAPEGDCQLAIEGTRIVRAELEGGGA